jgi:hypothetical protein
LGQVLEQQFRRFGILAIVVGGHILLVLLITSQRASDARKQSSLPLVRTVLVFLAEPRRELPRKIPEPTIEAPPRRNRPGDKSTEATNTNDDNGAAAGAPAGIPQIDWRKEAEVTIGSMAPRIAKEMAGKCMEAKRSGAAPPVGCKKDSYEPDWKPEPGRFGSSGLFPFVRLGERCVVGLGFFGCALGKLPQPDGTLLEDMRDPNRPTSSVPDIDPGGGTAELPPPVVMKEQ